MPLMDVTLLLIQPDGPERSRTLAALANGPAAHIATAASAAEALDFLFGRGRHAARANARQPQLLLVDLPLQEGLGLLEKVRVEPATSGLPVIVLLEPGGRGSQDAWYRAGANSVVLKSADDEEMRRKMQRLREFWVGVNVANRSSRA